MPDQSLRVALVTRNLEMGGAEHHIVKLCNAIPRSQVEFSLFLLVQDGPNDWLPELAAHVPVAISPYTRHDPRVIKWLADGLRASRAQVVHSFLWSADAIAALASALAHVPLICSERGDRGYAGPYAEGGLFDRYDRWVTFRLADRFSPNSNFGARLIEKRGYDPAKVQVIYNGVEIEQIAAAAPANLRRQLGWAAGTPIVGTVCSLVKRKSVDTLIRAVARLLETQRLYCAIIGDGPERPSLQRLASDLGIADQVAFLGQHVPAYPFTKALDIAVLATNQPTEMCSNSILEYMACSKPVVATRIAGNPELVVDGETGLLVEPDDVAGLAQAIAVLSADPAGARLMGARGRARIERSFRMEHIAAQHLALWRQVAAG